MVDLPEYLNDQTEETIRNRMLAAIPSDLDKSEGSFIWDSLSPAAIELAIAAIQAQEVLRHGFASTTFGDYLDLRCEEHGVFRRSAVKATGQVKFTGTAGTVIPLGTQVATSARQLSSQLIAPSIEFVTKVEVTLNGTGEAVVDIEAGNAGVAGNVSASSITLLSTPLPGVAGVINLQETTGGLDIEDDASLKLRYLQRVRSPSAGGNKADYVNWALEVAGVGGVSVVPVRDGPGTVSIAIINTNKEPAAQTLVDAVQTYIAPPWVNEVEVETMTLGGNGVSIDTTQADDSGNSVKMIYDAGGTGTIKHTGMHSLLQHPGIWQARVKVKADITTGTSNLLEIGIWNVSAGAWAKISPSSLTDAVQVLQADDLGASFADEIQTFYWNGQDQLELRITRLLTDTTTVVWSDKALYRSTFSRDNGDGKAPIGARVTVATASSLLINVTATLSIAVGYNAASVKAAAQQAIGDYIKSLAFTDDNDVRSVRIGQAILDTVGVLDYSNLLVNGNPSNITVGEQEVAVMGTVTLT